MGLTADNGCSSMIVTASCLEAGDDTPLHCQMVMMTADRTPHSSAISTFFSTRHFVMNYGAIMIRPTWRENNISKGPR